MIVACTWCRRQFDLERLDVRLDGHPNHVSLLGVLVAERDATPAPPTGGDLCELCRVTNGRAKRPPVEAVLS